jgi:hypothetical protein
MSVAFKEFLQPAIIAAVVTAIVGPLIFHLLKHRDEKRRRSFDIRYAEYKHYLKALEQVASSSLADFEKSMATTYADCLKEILATEVQSNGPLVRLNHELNELTSKIRKSFTQATQELHGLRLVCSGKLLKMVNEFVNLQRELIDESCSVMSRIQKIDVLNPQTAISGEMKAKGERTQQLFDAIVLQMRKELGIK